MTDLREKILSIKDTKVEKVHIKAWGTDVYLRSFTVADRCAFEAETTMKTKEIKEEGSNEVSVVPAETPSEQAMRMYALFACFVLCDEKGQRLFKDDEVAKFHDKSFEALEEIFDAGKKLNGISDETVEQAEKN